MKKNRLQKNNWKKKQIFKKKTKKKTSKCSGQSGNVIAPTPNITVLVFIKREIFKFFKVLGSFSLLSGLRKFLIVLELLKTTPNKLKTICNSKDLIQKIINLKNCCKDKHFKSLFLLTDFLFQLFCLKHYRFVGFKCMAIIKVL